MSGTFLLDELQGALTLPQAAKLVPNPRRPGKVVDWHTLERWATRGVRGVILKSWILGGCRVATPTAIEDFLRALNAGGSVEADDRRALRRSREAGKALEALGC